MADPFFGPCRVRDFTSAAEHLGILSMIQQDTLKVYQEDLAGTVTVHVDTDCRHAATAAETVSTPLGTLDADSFLCSCIIDLVHDSVCEPDDEIFLPMVRFLLTVHLAAVTHARQAVAKSPNKTNMTFLHDLEDRESRYHPVDTVRQSMEYYTGMPLGDEVQNFLDLLDEKIQEVSATPGDRARKKARTVALQSLGKCDWLQHMVLDDTPLLVAHLSNMKVTTPGGMTTSLGNAPLHAALLYALRTSREYASGNLAFYHLPRFAYEVLQREIQSPGATLQAIPWDPDLNLAELADLFDPLTPGMMQSLHNAAQALQLV